MNKLTVLSLTLLIALSNALQAATTYEQDLAKLNNKWELKRAKEQLKEKQKIDKDKLKRAQKIDMLNLELNQTTIKK